MPSSAKVGTKNSVNLHFNFDSRFVNSYRVRRVHIKDASTFEIEGKIKISIVL